MIVAVTGASGFIGAHLVAALVQEGTSVRAIVRSAAAKVPEGAARCPVADLADASALARAFKGADAVVHLAGRAHLLRDQALDPIAAFRQVNVEGTRQVISAAATAGVGRFLLASSVKAVGEETEIPWTEHTVPAPVDPYGRSKLEAEQLTRAHDRPGAMRTTILRLPLVYGPGAGANVRRLIKLVESGFPLPLASVRNRRSMAFVGNVVAAINAVLRSPGTAGETLYVSDGEDLSTPQLIRLIAASLGRPARLVRAPVGFLELAGRMADRFGIPVGSQEVRRLTRSLVVDASRLGRLAGFHPPFSAAEGWRLGVAAYLAEREG